MLHFEYFLAVLYIVSQYINIPNIKIIHKYKEYYYEKELTKCNGIYLTGKLKGFMCNNFINVNNNNENENNENENKNKNKYCRYHQKQSKNVSS